MHVLEQGLLMHQTKLSITWSKHPWHYECLRHVSHHQIKWSFGCPLIVNFRLGWQHWRTSWLGGSREVFCTPFVGIPTYLSWVFPPLQWPKHLCGLFQVLFIRTDYISGAAFVLTPLRSTVQASSLCLTCFDVALSFMSVHFMQGVTLFCFLEENCIKALTHIHSTTRLL